MTTSSTTETGLDTSSDAGPSDAISDATAVSDSAEAAPETALGDGTGCQVKEVLATPIGDSGTVLYTTRLSDPDPGATTARIEADSTGKLTVVCTAAGRERLRLEFGPYKALGSYDLAVGKLVIDGKTSDRVCSVSVSSGGSAGALRGFVRCPTEPYSDANVFAHTEPPIGLAGFEAKP